MSGFFRSFHILSGAGTSSLLRGATLGAGLSIGLMNARKTKILNDSLAVGPDTPILASSQQQQLNRPAVRKGRFGGKLDYQQLSIGSFTGLLLGYVTGKVSKLLVFLFVTGFLTFQFLESRGLVESGTLPLSKRLYKWGYDHGYGAKDYILEKPSFRISFISSFVIAAFNA